MGKLHFNLIKLTPEQAKRNIRLGDFPEKNAAGFLHVLSRSKEADIYVSASAIHCGPNYPRDFPTVAMKGVPGKEVEMSVIQTFYFDGLKNKLTVWFDFPTDYEHSICGSNNFFGNANLLNRELDLPPGALVTGVYTGDYNNDQYTDLLIRLSNGAAYVFEQVPGDPPKMECIQPPMVPWRL